MVFVAGGSSPRRIEALAIGSQAVLCGSDKGFWGDMSKTLTVSVTYADKYKKAIKKNKTNRGANKYILYVPTFEIKIHITLSTVVTSKDSRVEERMDSNFLFYMCCLFYNKPVEYF